MTDRRLLAALGFSLLLHATVVGSPGWRLPFLNEPAPGGVLEAHLAPKPVPALQPAAEIRPELRPEPRPVAKKPRPPQPAPVESPSREVVAPEATAEPAAAPMPPAAPATITTPAPVELSWPRQGRIRFAVMRGEGEQGMQVGQSTHTWQHDGASYALRSVTETTGLVALFRSVRIVQSSEGTLAAEGLVPQSFSVERNGKPAERARFDWNGSKVTIQPGGGGGREVPLAPGAQDILSQIYQIGLLGAAARIELMIATGKSYDRYAYEAAGDEKLATRLGELRTWHVKTPAVPGEQAMELWLASDYRNLPVRIRFIDRKGNVFDQNAVELEVDGTALAERQQ
ncbi:MAG: DUF3108 domain-containing protein [Gallionellaceae bacterium]|nr:DUF3108 domain-containing protein [Gallionellaceae bacterium]